MARQFFPASSRPELLVDLRLPEGSSFAASLAATKKMEAILRKDEDVRFFTAYTGAGAPRFYLALDPELPGHDVYLGFNRKMDLVHAESTKSAT